MLTIIEKYVSQIEVSKSKFISVVGHISNKDDFNQILNDIKKEYPFAKHYCYAYIVKEYTKSSDDGEPSGTAGKPLLTTLLNNNLVDCYVITIRYFGGVKLGASNLLRTYIESVNKSIKESKKGELVSLEKAHLILDDNDELYTLNNLKKTYCIELENIIYNNKIELDVLTKSDLVFKIKEIFKGKYIINRIDKVDRIVEVEK